MKNNNSTFLLSFFKKLNSINIDYCVLRNYSFLPASTNGSDLDILINKKDSKCFFNLVKELADYHNGKIVSIIDSEICPRICALGNKEVGWGIMIDLHYDVISYRGYTIFSNKNVWCNTFKYNGQITALNKKVDSLNGLFKELLNNGICDQKYFSDFKNSSIDERFLNEVFNEIKKTELIPALLKFKNETYSKDVIKNFVKILNIN